MEGLQRDGMMDDLAGVRFTGNVAFGSADGVELLLDCYTPEPRPAEILPALVWVHGGGWESGDKRGGYSDVFGPMLARAGFVFATVDYRLSGQALFPAQIHDVKAAIRWMRANATALGIDPDRIGIWGHSAGGHLAALAGVSGDIPELEGESGSPGVSSRVQAALPLSPATDFRIIPGGWTSIEPRRATEKLVGGRLEERADLVRMANPMTHIRPGVPPFLIVHGAADGVVPVEQGIALADALRSVGGDVTLDVLPGADHWFASASRGVSTPDALDGIGRLAIAFFSTHLGTPPNP
ncbi:MAG: alpha/beta hydrolase [Thermomicrobiales bacterium]